jgi:hypothetical protein
VGAAFPTARSWRQISKSQIPVNFEEDIEEMKIAKGLDTDEAA